jgi:hypothetical protein
MRTFNFKKKEKKNIELKKKVGVCARGDVGREGKKYEQSD